MNEPSQTAPTRRRFMQGLAAAAAAPAFASAPALLRAADHTGDRPPVLGEGEHTYEAIHDWLAPPDHIKWGDTHGVAQDAEGRIYIAHTVNASSESGDAVAVFDEDGRFIKSWGEAFRGGAHGFDIRDERGEQFIYHCDTGRRIVVKTTLDGEVLWEKGVPREPDVYGGGDHGEGESTPGGFRPTNVAFASNGDFYIGDGYGSHYIHQYDAEGNYKRVIGRPGGGAGELNTPHGLWVDPRGGEELAVADRGNNRIQYFSLDGEPLRIVTDAEWVRRPCHFDIRGDLMLCPDLASLVTILDREGRVVARLGDGHPTNLRGEPRERFIPGKFIHPHDAIFTREGNIIVAEWVPNGRITLLRKVS